MTTTGSKTEWRLGTEWRPRTERRPSAERRPRAVRRLASLLAVLVAGCASASGGESPFTEREMQIRLHVLNLNWADARLYAHRSSQRVPLGTVAGKGEETFTLDWPMSFPLRVEFDLLAGGRCITRELSVDPGDMIDLQIPSAIRGGVC